MKFHKIDVRGKFWLPRETSLSSVTHQGHVDEGRLFYAIAEDAIYYGDQDEWQLIARQEDVFEDETKVIMGYYPLPDYWNIDTGFNDIVPIISDTESQAGDTGGFWAIAGMSTDGSHDHGGLTGGPTQDRVLGASEIYTTVARNNHRHSLQVDGLHSHTFDGTWRPRYKKYFMVRYDVR